MSPRAGVVGIESDCRRRSSAVDLELPSGTGYSILFGLMPLVVPLVWLPLTWLDMIE